MKKWLILILFWIWNPIQSNGIMKYSVYSNIIDSGNDVFSKMSSENVSIVPRKSQYDVNEEVSIDFYGFAGNAKDWISIAKSGSKDTEYITFKFLEGKTSGTITLPGQLPGVYEIRGFYNNEYTVRVRATIRFGQSGEAVNISTDKTNFNPNEEIRVNFSGFPGFAKDWIAISKAGSADNEYITFKFVEGKYSGSIVLPGLSPGTYEIRGYFNNEYTVRTRKSIQVGETGLTAKVICTKSGFAPGEEIIIDFSGFPGNAKDWIAIAKTGTVDNNYITYKFLEGKTSGRITLPAQVAGNYEIRGYFNNEYTVRGRCEITVENNNLGSKLTLDKTQFTPGEKISVYFTAPATYAENAWVGLLPANIQHGSEALNDQHELTYQYLSKKTSGTLTFTAPEKEGNYDFRMHDTDDNGKEVTYIAFSVLPKQDIILPSLTLDKTQFTAGEKISVHFTAPLTYPENAWVGLLPANIQHGSEAVNDQNELAYQYLSKKTSGTLTFTAPEKEENYDFRMHDTDNNGKEVASVAFSVIPKQQGPGLTLNKTEFLPGEDIVVSFTGFSGNAKDWISIAAAGSADNTYITFKFLEGKKSGSITLPAQSAGSYEVRGYFNNEYTVRVKTTFKVVPPDVVAKVVCTKSGFAPGEDIIIDFSGFPGNAKDWISIAKTGTADNSYITFKFLEGKTSGTITIPGQVTGNYEIRGYFNNEYTVRSRCQITVTDNTSGPGLTLDKTQFTSGEKITVYFTAPPTYPENAWVGLLPANIQHGSEAVNDQNELAYQYLSKKTSGTLTFTAPEKEGNYDFRMHDTDNNGKEVASVAFSVIPKQQGPGLTLNKTEFLPGEDIVVSFTGFSGNAKDWISIAAAGSADNTYITFKFLEGKKSGSITLPAQSAGSYEVRGYFNNEYTVRVKTTFKVVPPDVIAEVVCTKSGFAPGEDIIIDFSGFPGNAKDWIAIAKAGTADNSYITFKFLEGKTSGTITIPGQVAGNYEIRGYFNNEYTVRSRCQINISKSSNIDLTGLWADDKGSTYKIRQTGNDIYWFMDDFMIRTQIFVGKIDNNRIIGEWVDLPYSEKLLKGNAEYKIYDNNRIICDKSDPNMGVQYITREMQ